MNKEPETQIVEPKKNFFQRLFSPTPTEWKRRAKSFGILAATFTTAFGSVKALNITTPEYFDIFIGITIFLCSAVATYSQQHELEK